MRIKLLRGGLRKAKTIELSADYLEAPEDVARIRAAGTDSSAREGL
jgi:hypothetical protein